MRVADAGRLNVPSYAIVQKLDLNEQRVPRQPFTLADLLPPRECAGPRGGVVQGHSRDADRWHHCRAQRRVFTEHEAAALLPLPAAPYHVPVFSR
jgi:hypothetical protein